MSREVCQLRNSGYRTHSFLGFPLNVCLLFASAVRCPRVWSPRDMARVESRLSLSLCVELLLSKNVNRRPTVVGWEVLLVISPSTDIKRVAAFKNLQIKAGVPISTCKRAGNLRAKDYLLPLCTFLEFKPVKQGFVMMRKWVVGTATRCPAEKRKDIRGLGSSPAFPSPLQCLDPCRHA